MMPGNIVFYSIKNFPASRFLRPQCSIFLLNFFLFRRFSTSICLLHYNIVWQEAKSGAEKEKNEVKIKFPIRIWPSPVARVCILKQNKKVYRNLVRARAERDSVVDVCRERWTIQLPVLYLNKYIANCIVLGLTNPMLPGLLANDVTVIGSTSNLFDLIKACKLSDNLGKCKFLLFKVFRRESLKAIKMGDQS